MTSDMHALVIALIFILFLGQSFIKTNYPSIIDIGTGPCVLFSGVCVSVR